MGEVRSEEYVDLQTIARKTIKKIGYTKSEYQFDGDSCGVLTAIHEQSDDINRGVSREEDLDQGAGDQGMMFGYATNETDNYMPVSLDLAQLIMRTLADIRREGKVMTYLRPDSKSQVTVEYDDNGRAARIDTIESYYRRSMELLRPEIRMELFTPQRPILAKENDSPSSYIDPEGGCVNSLVADGCDIQGSVKNCVLFRNVRIEKGASVENCILFKDTVVKRGAVLRGVITDKYVTISENVTLMGHERYPIVIAKGATV